MRDLEIARHAMQTCPDVCYMLHSEIGLSSNQNLQWSFQLAWADPCSCHLSSASRALVTSLVGVLPGCGHCNAMPATVTCTHSGCSLCRPAVNSASRCLRMMYQFCFTVDIICCCRGPESLKGCPSCRILSKTLMHHLSHREANVGYMRMVVNPEMALAARFRILLHSKRSTVESLKASAPQQYAARQ